MNELLKDARSISAGTAAMMIVHNVGNVPVKGSANVNGIYQTKRIENVPLGKG